MKGPFIVWHDRYDTGIKSIDMEHQNLVNVINEFHADLNSRRIDKAESFTHAAHKLISYVKEHFSNEEKWMIETKYPKFAEQHAAHQYFIKRLLEDAASFKGYDPRSAYHFLEFLKEWFSTHVAISDNEFKFHKARLDEISKRLSLPDDDTPDKD